MSKSRQIFRGCEQAGVSRNAAQHAGVFILHFALDDPLSKRAVIGGRRNRSSPRCRRIVRSVHHSQRAKYFALAETIKALVGNTLQRDRQNDKADIAVLGSRAGIGGEWGGESRGQQFVSGLGLQKELFIRGQSGGVCQQHVHGYIAAPRHRFRQIQARC